MKWFCRTGRLIMSCLALLKLDISDELKGVMGTHDSAPRQDARQCEQGRRYFDATFMRVYGALMWSLKVMFYAQKCLVCTWVVSGTMPLANIELSGIAAT
jgi:hypothetical protein